MAEEDQKNAEINTDAAKQEGADKPAEGADPQPKSEGEPAPTTGADGGAPAAEAKPSHESAMKKVLIAIEHLAEAMEHELEGDARAIIFHAQGVLSKLGLRNAPPQS